MAEVHTVRIDYYAAFRERRGCSQEVVQTRAATPLDLYAELQARHAFPWPADTLRVAVNDEFSPWSGPLSDGDRIVFLTPVSGG
jgi:molybdopterin converting factor small subunit